MAKIGQGKLNLHPCTPEQMEQNLTIIEQKFEFFEEQGTVDSEKTRATAAGTPQFLDGLLFNTGVVFDAGLHQAVYGEVADNSGQLQIRFFTAIGTGGGGDTYRVKRDAADASPQYLADCWATGNYNATDSYVAATHFHVTVSPTGTNDLRLYCPYAIIKVDANDGSPGYLIDKVADEAVYEPGVDLLVRAVGNGGTVRWFVDADDFPSFGGGLHTVSAGAIIDAITVDGTATVSWDHTEISGWNSGGTLQSVVHENGTLKWLAPNTSIKVPTGAPVLEIDLSEMKLRLTMTYAHYIINGLPDTPSTSEEVTEVSLVAECPEA